MLYVGVDEDINNFNIKKNLYDKSNQISAVVKLKNLKFCHFESD
jgi:hypothetical protein